MMKLTQQCFLCKQEFRKTELISYASASAKVSHWYCPECLKEKQSRERFSNKICMIFGIKQPGPRIWTERKRLIDKYGYTDDLIIDCLDYIYNIENKKKLVESLTLVTPTTMNKMLQWKRTQEAKGKMLSAAMDTKTTTYIVPIKENIGEEEKLLNADDYLDF